MLAEDSQTAVMRYLSDRLSAKLPDLVKALGRPEEELKQAIQELERQELITRTKDPIAGCDLISPTSMGLLRFRQRYSPA